VRFSPFLWESNRNGSPAVRDFGIPAGALRKASFGVGRVCLSKGIPTGMRVGALMTLAVLLGSKPK